ncbi:TAXI family TRAP transporter solute-binding subunit [Alkalilimnicola ehrlichii]|nr:TAXI family TRAP transporter solute-binding subunit [Alkalilimnicola ehrlichii]
MTNKMGKGIGLVAGAVAALGLASSVQADEINLPSTLIWSAYPTGTTGYGQAVGIGNVLQNRYGVNLRVVPGRNDVSRMEPLRRGRANFVFGGSEAMSVQEGLRDFGVRGWGPQPIRVGLWNLSDACSFALQVHADSDMHTIEDIKGKRVPFVQGAAAPNAGFEYLMRYGNLTWDDVQVVEIGGYMGMVEAFIDNRLDVKWNSCDAAVLHRVANAPRGFRFIEFPHDNEEAVARVSEEAPWFVPHVATKAVGVDVGDGIEVFSSPYPLMTTLVTEPEDTVYGLVRAMHQHHDEYIDSAPGQEGWAMERQAIETSFVPFHDGAIRYFKEIGVWTEEAQRNHEQQVRRQQLLMEAWENYVADAPRDEQAFAEGWMEVRYNTLVENDMIPLSRRW